MNRIKEALDKAEKRLQKDAVNCAAKCQDLGSIIAEQKQKIEKEKQTLSDLIQRFEQDRENHNKVQGQLTLLAELKNSIA